MLSAGIKKRIQVNNGTIRDLLPEVGNVLPKQYSPRQWVNITVNMIIVAVLAGGVSSKLKLKRQKVLEGRGKSTGRIANKGGKSKNVGKCHGLALLSGRCTSEAMAKGRVGMRAGVWHR